MDRTGNGFRLFLDGNAWCAVGPEFIDLMRSHAGFGATKGEAVADYAAKVKHERRFRHLGAPAIEMFAEMSNANT